MQKGSWMKSKSFSEQVAFDLRDSKIKALMQEFKSVNSLKKELDVWEDKPIIIAQEQVEKQEDATLCGNSTLYLLKAQG